MDETTNYFREKVLRDRPYLNLETCRAVIANPIRREVEPNGRIRHWAIVQLPGLGQRPLRVVNGRTEERSTTRSRIAASAEVAMKITYYADTDTLYISLSDRPGADVEEVAPGFVVDLDSDGRPVGIEIDPASSLTDPGLIETNLKVGALKLKPTAQR